MSCTFTSNQIPTSSNCRKERESLEEETVNGLITSKPILLNENLKYIENFPLNIIKKEQKYFNIKVVHK
jgi:hypothetical protein